MKCKLCRGDYRESPVVLSFQRAGQTVVVENVPALVCERCGDELVEESTAHAVERLLAAKPYATAPLYRFPEKLVPAT